MINSKFSHSDVLSSGWQYIKTVNNASLAPLECKGETLSGGFHFLLSTSETCIIIINIILKKIILIIQVVMDVV